MPVPGHQAGMAPMLPTSAAILGGLRFRKGRVEQVPVDASGFRRHETHRCEGGRIVLSRHGRTFGGSDKDQRLRRYRPPGEAFVEAALVETEGDVDPAFFQPPQQRIAARDLQPEADVGVVASENPPATAEA